jgi:hypothetical protein
LNLLVLVLVLEQNFIFCTHFDNDK